jgi:hypothetical protein
MAKIETEQYYSCCGKSICGGCFYSFCMTGNIDTSVCSAMQREGVKQTKREMKN